MPKTFRIFLALSALAIAALVAAGCGGSDVPSDSVAKVGDTKITKAQFNHWFLASVKQQAQSTGQKPDQVVAPDPPNFTKCIAAKQKQPLPQGVPKPDAKALKAQCKQEYDGIQQQTLQFLITSQWLVQEAAKRHIVATDKEVQTTFQQQKKQSFPKEADYQKFLQTSGQTETDLLFRVKLSVLTNKIQQAIVKDKGNVSDAQIQDYYNKNKSRFAQPETRDLQVVLATKQPKANAALKAIKSGTPWPKVAKQYSSDTASKSQGGRLPGVTKGQQEKTFDAAIFSAPKNKVLGPIKTQFGYYVFRVTKITPAKQQTLAQVKTTIKNLLQSQNQQKALNDFVKDWQKRSKAKTVCAKGFIVQQCSNAPKPKTNTAPASGGSPQTGGTPQTGTPQQVPVPPSGAGGASGAPPSGTPQPVPPSGGGAGGAAPPSGP
jgi:foldase protein PrsA